MLTIAIQIAISEKSKNLSITFNEKEENGLTNFEKMVKSLIKVIKLI